MINIDKLSEAQVRYILNGLIGSEDYFLLNFIQYHMEQPYYPQDNNEGDES